MKEQDLHIELLADMKKKNIDIALTLDILNRYNAGQFDHYERLYLRECRLWMVSMS